MTEDRIIKIIKRETKRMSTTGKLPPTGALPAWCILLDHCITYLCDFSLTVAAKIGFRMRTFFVVYNSRTKRHISYIDGVPYE